MPLLKTFLSYLKEDSTTDDTENANTQPETPEQRAQKQLEKEKKRKDEKLMPNEYDSPDGAKQVGERLKIPGFHTVGSGKYKPGNSEDSLRDALAKRKEDNAQKRGVSESLNIASLPADLIEAARKMREDNEDAARQQWANKKSEASSSNDDDDKEKNKEIVIDPPMKNMPYVPMF